MFELQTALNAIEAGIIDVYLVLYHDRIFLNAQLFKPFSLNYPKMFVEQVNQGYA